MVKFESGYFDRENRKYIITNMTPTRPLINHIWNEKFMMTLDHFGCGDSFGKVAYAVRRGLVGGEGSRLIYIKDRENGKYFCANNNFSSKPIARQEAHVYPGGHTVIGEEMGIRSTLSLTAPLKGFAELWKVEVENLSDRERDLSLYAHCRLLCEYGGHKPYNRVDWNEELGGILYSHKIYQYPGSYKFEHDHFYFSCSDKVNSYTTCNSNFKGIYRSFAEPIAMESDALPNDGTSYSEYITTAVELRVPLKAGEKRTIYFVAGMSKNTEEAIADAKKYLAPGFYEDVMAERTAIVKKAEKVCTIETNNEYMDDMVNIWLKNQIDLGKTWARVYCCGFRDVLQDVAAFGSFNPEIARQKILLTLSHQRPSGKGISGWEPVGKADSRDGSSWIPETVAVYIKETGDTGILDDECPYFESDEKGTVLDHMRRGINFLTTAVGEHGLVLWGGSDWNDSTNAAGIRGRGESVWLSIATVKALKTFAQILRQINLDDEAEKWIVEADKMAERVKKYGWDSDHYIAGYNDDMKKIGAYESEGAKFYLNMQSWAVLSEIETGEDAHKLMDRVEEKLHCPYGYVQCTPSYSKGDPTIGRTSYFLPGSIENGSVYNHGVAFKIAADCQLGRGELAYKSIREIMADNPELYNCGVEPYAVTNMYMGPEQPYEPKFAPCSWITGTAGWMYRCITEYLLGVQADFDGLRIVPCIPTELDGSKISRVFRGAKYNVTVHKGACKMLVDGKEFEGNLVPIFPEGTTHEVEVWC